MITTTADAVLDPQGRPLDRIRLRGVSATGYHGVLEHERVEGQVFRADVVLHLDTRPAAAEDDLAETVSYAEVAREVADILAGSPAQLVETVAERIAAVALAHAAVVAVDVTVHKPQAPMPVAFDDVEVSIRRDRVVAPVVAALPVESSASHAAVAGGGSQDRGGSEAPGDGAGLGAPGSTRPEGAPEPEVASGPQSVAPIPVGSVAPALIMGGAQVAATQVATASDPLLAPAPAVMPPSIPPSGAETAEPEGVSPERAPFGAGFGAEPVGAEQFAAEPASVPGVDDEAPTEAQAFPDVPADEAEDVSVPEAPDAAEVREAAPVPVVSSAEPPVVTGAVREHDRMDEVPAGFVEVVLALGSNVGDPQQTLRDAITDLDRIPGLEITEVSPLARTAAAGGPEHQPDYLNTVLLARTRLSARDLLHACQSVELAHGRIREERWGPRTLDVDLIVYGTLTDVADDIELPHPRAHERAFVLEPWSQVDPDAVLPGLGGGPVATLAATAPDRAGIRWLALDWLTEPAPAMTGALPVQRPPEGFPGARDEGRVDTPAQAQVPLVATEESAPEVHTGHEVSAVPGAPSAEAFAESFSPVSAPPAAPPAAPEVTAFEAGLSGPSTPTGHEAPAQPPAAAPGAAWTVGPDEEQDGPVFVPVHVQAVTPPQGYTPEYAQPEELPPAPQFAPMTSEFAPPAPDHATRAPDVPAFPNPFAPVQGPPPGAGAPSPMEPPVVDTRPVAEPPVAPFVAHVPVSHGAGVPDAPSPSPFAPVSSAPQGADVPQAPTVHPETPPFVPVTPVAPDAYPSADDIFPSRGAQDGPPAAAASAPHPAPEQPSPAPFPFAPVDSGAPSTPSGQGLPGAGHDAPGHPAPGSPFDPVGSGAGSAPGPLADPEGDPDQQGPITRVPPIFPTGQ